MRNITFINKDENTKGKFIVGNHYTDSNFNKVSVTAKGFNRLVRSFIKEDFRRTPALKNFKCEVTCFINSRGQWVYSACYRSKVV